jgi:hypothetical protein
MLRLAAVLTACLVVVAAVVFVRAEWSKSNPKRSASASEWCVPVSRDTAISRVTVEIAPGDKIETKLVSWPELRAARGTGGPLNSPLWNDSTKLWLVEATGPLRLPMPPGYSWGVFSVDAQSDHVLGGNAGHEVAAPYWDSLPDHSHDCN